MRSVHKFTASLESMPGPRCSFNPEDQQRQEDVMEVIELSEDEMEVNIKDEIKVFMDCLRFFKPY